MGRATRIGGIVVVTVVVAILAVVSIRGRDDVSRSWPRFCDEAYTIATVNRTREPARSVEAHRQSLAQVDALAARAPAAAVESDLRTAAPVLVRPFSSGALDLTSKLLAATTRSDTALVDHCGVGRSIFDPRTLARRPPSASAD